MGLFSKVGEKEKIINEYGDELAHDVFSTIFTHYSYANLLSQKADHRKWIWWKAFIGSGPTINNPVLYVATVKYGPNFLNVISENIGNNKLIKELEKEAKIFTNNRLIAAFEKFYAGIDFSKIRRDSKLICVDDYINRIGEEKGHAFLVVYYTTLHFLQMVKRQKKYNAIVEFWDEFSMKYMSVQYGTKTVEEYKNEVNSEEFRRIKPTITEEMRKEENEFLNPLMINTAAKILGQMGIYIYL